MFHSLLLNHMKIEIYARKFDSWLLLPPHVCVCVFVYCMCIRARRVSLLLIVCRRNVAMLIVTIFSTQISNGPRVNSTSSFMRSLSFKFVSVYGFISYAHSQSWRARATHQINTTYKNLLSGVFTLCTLI